MILLKKLFITLKRKLGLSVILKICNALLFVWICLSLFCARELHTITDTQLLLMQTRLRFALLCCAVLVIAASVGECVWLSILRKREIKTASVIWKQNRLYTETKTHIVKSVSYAELADIRKRYVAACICDGVTYKIRNFNLYGGTYYEDTNNLRYIAKCVFSLIVGLPVNYSVYMRQTKSGMKFTAYTFIFSDMDNITYYVRKLPFFRKAVDIFALDTKNCSVRDKNTYLRAVHYTAIPKQYAYMVLLLVLWIYLAVLLILQAKLCYALLLPVITYICIAFIKYLVQILRIELRKFIYVMKL